MGVCWGDGGILCRVRGVAIHASHGRCAEHRLDPDPPARIPAGVDGEQLSGVSDEVLATRMHEYSLVDPEADAEDVGAGSGGGGAARRRPPSASLAASPADVVQGMHAFGSPPLSSSPAAGSCEASANRRR
jgi:hypothetical protein